MYKRQDNTSDDRAPAVETRGRGRDGAKPNEDRSWPSAVVGKVVVLKIEIGSGDRPRLPWVDEGGAQG